ncbi:MAG: hypothetical protein P1U85_19600 [Verrucomicrobiales bacterium]|nr:hypothetical protein [Verrucomicrobiales bacterium]
MRVQGRGKLGKISRRNDAACEAGNRATRSFRISAQPYNGVEQYKRLADTLEVSPTEEES